MGGDPPGPADPGSEQAEGAGEGAPGEGRQEELVPVRGHLKRQRYGPGGSLIKWIFVEGC